MDSAVTTAGTDISLAHLLHRQAEQRGDRLGFVFLEDGGQEADRLTFGELDAEARAIAGWLAASHAPGERALLLFPAGLDFLKAFFGCVYAGLIAIPAPPPEASRRKRTLPRLQSIARDADVTLVMSTGDTLAMVRDAVRDVPELADVHSIDVRDAPQGSAASWRMPEIDTQQVAYLQYTSGSTTAPKGVMISHANVLHHCKDLREGCGYGPDSVSVTWLPYFHDYGLIEGLLVPLQNGTPCYVMSPFAFLKRPFAWLNAISRFKATHSQGPNFAFDQCVRRIKPDQLGKLDLSHVVSLGNGAEPVNPAVEEAFLETFGPRGLRAEALSPAYGLAEATLMMSCCRPGQAPRFTAFDSAALGERRAEPVADRTANSRRITSCGAPLGAIQVAIVDPESRRRCGSGEIGEIWLSDPAVALGYWKRPDETRETFEAFTSDTKEGPFLRTGDLGFLHDGELYISGRIKDLIIVAGANHYPQDIEWTAERAHPAIRPNHVAASSYFAGGEERLLVAPEVERGTLGSREERDALLNAVRLAVSEAHEVPVHAVVVLRRASLPKTASGKIQRHACERFLRELGPEVEAAWTADAGWLETEPRPAPVEAAAS